MQSRFAFALALNAFTLSIKCIHILHFALPALGDRRKPAPTTFRGPAARKELGMNSCAGHRASAAPERGNGHVSSSGAFRAREGATFANKNAGGLFLQLRDVKGPK